jgi:choline dehydrogenase-like flavoprotein
MPDYLRVPMLAATLGFDAAGLLHSGKRFHRQPPEMRQRQITAWKNSSAGFKRDLIRYHESLAALALYSRETSQPTPALSTAPRENAVLQPTAEMRAEVVVVGSGPGGAITACLLAEAGRQVLLVEEGPFYPLNSCAPFSKEEMLQKYRNGGQTVALGRNKISYVEGRCVGGGSEINSALYHRTPPEMLERWRKEFQVEALSESEMRPHFEACEHDVSVSLLPGPAPVASLKLHEGATRLGWKSLEVPRWFRYDSVGSNSIKGTRQSMTETYLPRFLRAGGKLLSQTRVHRFRQDGAKWILRAGHGPANQIRIVAESVFLCAGAVQTPALLRRSGVTRNVGDSLQMHPTIKIVAKFPEAVNAADMGVPVHQVKEFAPRLSFGCSISSPAYLALGLLDHPAAARTVAQAWPQMAIYYAMITSEGHGSIRTLPGFADPLVRYALTDNDRRNLADGLKKLAQILFESGASALYPTLARGQELLRRDDLAKLPEIVPDGMTNLMTIHLFSSCPLGEARAQCAADSFGRVHGFKNLFINDASLLCTAPGVNPQGSIMALARRNALHFFGKT